MEKNDTFINRKGEMLKVETEGILNLWVRQGITFLKKLKGAAQNGWGKQDKEHNAIITMEEKKL